MSLVALGMLSFGLSDLLRWPASAVRLVVATLGAACAAVAGAWLAGAGPFTAGVIGLVTLVVLGIWQVLPEDRPGRPLAWVATVLVVLFATSGSVEPVGGELRAWYEGLGFPFVRAVSVDQFFLGLGAALFLPATSNRIVRFVLAAAGTAPEGGEKALRGGRLLGPMERLIVGAILLAGDPAAAAIVIAAKGLLRFPEIRADPGQPDQVTEYFLIGTFSSLVLAAGVAILASASG